MALIEILGVTKAEADPAVLWGHHIDLPQAGTKIDGHEFRVTGWALGRSCPSVAVELVHQDKVIRRLPMNHPRPDLRDAYPDVPDAEQGGFSTTASLLGMGELEVGVRAVLSDQRRVPLATVRAQATKWARNQFEKAL